MALSSCANSRHQQIDPDKRQKLAHIHYQIGVDAISKEGMLPKAFEELMESNAILPNQPHVLDMLAYAWLLRGDLKKSESYYIKALKYGDNASIHNNYASLLNRQEEYKKAEKNARKALDDPRYSNQDLAFINLGNALLGQKNFPEAIQAFQQAKLFNPSSALPDLRVADAFYQQNKLPEARLLYETIINQQQDSRNAAEGLLAVLLKQDDNKKARKMLALFSQRTSSTKDKTWALNQLDRLDRL